MKYKPQEKFIRKGFPENWFDYAFELKNAAENLWKGHSHSVTFYDTHDEGTYHRKTFSRTYFLLMGLAIENLCKGILISENPEYLRDGQISKEISSGHNLSILSSKIKTLNFEEKEKEILRVLSEVIPYWGKYPIPKNFNDLKSEIFISDQWFNDLCELYNKLEVKILQLNHDGIMGPNGIDFPKFRMI